MLFESIDSLIKIFSPQKMYHFPEGGCTLSELAGYSQDDRLLILNLDDIGLCPSTNATVEYFFQADKKFSISILSGAAGFMQAVALLKKNNLSAGVHLTLTTEWESGIIKPILPAEKIASLLNEQGGLYSEISDLYRHADNAEVEAECRAQIELVKKSGIELDHLDTHMGAMQLRPDFVEIYLNLAHEYRLPVRLGSDNLAELMGLPKKQLQNARDRRIIFPDNLIYIPMSFTSEKTIRFAAYDFAVKNIPAGITEIYFHPTRNGTDYNSLRHAYSAHKKFRYESIRLWDFEYLHSGRLEKILKDENIHLIDYADLAELQTKIRTV